MAVTKVIEVIGSSETGSDDAVREALAAAQRSIRGITSDRGLRGDLRRSRTAAIARWEALVKIYFPVEPR